MMFGFGDVSNPLPQSTQLMEDFVLDYVQQVLHKASAASEERHKLDGKKLRVIERDLLFVLRKDRRRYERVRELLEVWEEQKETRQVQGKEKLQEYEREEKDRSRGE